MAAIPPLDEDEIRALGAGRVVVRDGVLGPLADEVRAALVALKEAGGLTPAAVGKARVYDDAIRGDRSAWLERGEPPWGALWRWFDALRSEVNAAAWLGLRRFAVQLAWYPGTGAAYARHRDAFAGDRSRRMTAIVYLNPGWRPEHGGCLRVFEPDGPRDLEPLHDRLALFLSDALDHEVLPSAADRYAVTAWYRGDDGLPLLPDPDAAIY